MKHVTFGLLVGVVAVIAIAACSRGADESHSEHETHHGEDEFDRGPSGGRLLEDGDFAVEIVIAESGIPPEFHVYAYRAGKSVMASGFDVAIELERLGGVRDVFEFEPEGNYQRGIGTVYEPHSFDVSVTASHDGRSYSWAYENHEGRTQIADRIARESGIETEPAGPHTIRETVDVTGMVQANPARVSTVRARFPGVITDVRADTGDNVRRGDILARIETNESLRPLAVVAPIDGLVVDRNIQIGQVTGTEPLYIVADLSEVWIQLDIFGRDLARVRAGQDVTITTLDGTRFEGVIDFVSPLVAHGSQSVRARIPLENPDGALRAGQFVSAHVVVAENEVPIAIRREAVQTFRDFDVVYARVGDTYEVRMLELGRRNGEYVEVLSGLKVGEIYVSANSFLVKADIEKSGASHDH
jgi:cobalt-zinc-cadmium efflux system membrane fusion protein